MKWKSQRIFFPTFKLLPGPKFVSHFVRSDLISHLIMPCHSLSRLITPYPLGCKQNQFYLATLKLNLRPLIYYTSYHALSLLITGYHTLSPRLKTNSFSIGNFKISSQFPNFWSSLITPCHSLSHLITPYPQG